MSNSSAQAAATAREPIAVIGTGYVGLVTAAGFAELGSEVWCVDIDADKIARLERGEVPIYEPGLEELIARHAGRLHFATELGDALEHARLLFVAVGTPPTYSGDADLSAVHAVVDAIPASDRHALVMKSTVPSGTGAAIKRAFRDHAKNGLRYVSCPEFLKEGSAIPDFLHPDRVVVGDDADWAGDAVVELYRPLLHDAHGGAGTGELVRTDIASAEMVKLASNAFLATKISFINEIANVCEETGADVVQVAQGMGLDERIGPKFLQAGIGFGGSCFPKDVNALKQLAGNSGYHFQLLTAVIEVNELQKRRVIGKLQKHLGTLVGKRIALLGLAFKPDTDDMREASSLVLAARLHADGAGIVAYDPVAEDEARGLIQGIDFAGSALDAARDADALVLVTEWPQCTDLDWDQVAHAMRGRVVIDGRNALDRDAIRAVGLTYEGIGRGLPEAPRDRRREDRAGEDRTGEERAGEDRTGEDDAAHAPESPGDPATDGRHGPQHSVTGTSSREGRG
jgi:UDPglucose 6-dehydrogenase